MHCAAILAFALVVVVAPAFAQPTASQEPRPLTQAEGQIVAICRAEGGDAQSCRCGVDLARRAMSPRELSLVPVLWPIVNGPGAPLDKINRGLETAQARGFSAQEALTLVAKVEAHSARVRRECAA